MEVEHILDQPADKIVGIRKEVFSERKAKTFGGCYCSYCKHHRIGKILGIGR